MKPVKLVRKKWTRWRTHESDAAKIRKLRQQGRLEGRKITKAELLRLGLRPKRDDKIDEWKLLTDITKRRILRRSRKHTEFQLSIGIPKDTIYGPWPVMEGWGQWIDNVTHTTVGSTDE